QIDAQRLSARGERGRWILRREARHWEKAHPKTVERRGHIRVELGHGDLQCARGGDVHVFGPRVQPGPSHAENVAEHEECVGSDEHTAELEYARICERTDDAGRSGV